MKHAHTDEQREVGLGFLSRALRQRGMRILLGLMLLPGNLVAQQAGDLDTSFGAAGKVLTDIGGSNDEGQAVALQPDRKIVMSGYSFNVAAGFVDFALTRYLPDGNLDASFGGDGIVTTSFGETNAINHALALQPNGKIIAAGAIIGDTGTSFALARYLPNGSLDPTFSGDGRLTIDVGGGEVNAIVLQPGGKIVAVGTVALARFHPDGALDTTFGTAGVVNVDFEQLAAARQPNGKIVTAGQLFNVSTSRSEFALARFLSDGTLDTTFHGDGRVNTDLGGGGDSVAAAVALQPDGKIIAAGNVFSVANGHVDFALVRYLRNGALDTTFGGDGRVTTDFGSASRAFALTLQPDRKIVAAGEAFGIFGLARYLPNGTLDTNFSDDGLVTTSFGAGDASFARGLVLQPNGRLVAAGSSTFTGEGGFDFALARYRSRRTGPPTNEE